MSIFFFLQFHIPLYQRISLCRIAALIPSVLAATLETSYPSAMDDATQIGNIIASFCVPFSVLPMLKFCCSKRLMGVSIDATVVLLRVLFDCLSCYKHIVIGGYFMQEHVMNKYQAYLIGLVAIFLISMNGSLLWEYSTKLV